MIFHHYHLISPYFYLFNIIVRALCEHCCRNSITAVDICNDLIEKRAQTLKEELEVYVLIVEIYLCMNEYKVPAVPVPINRPFALSAD